METETDHMPFFINKEIEPVRTITSGEGPCALQARFTLKGEKFIERFDPKKVKSLYGLMTLLHFSDVVEGRDLLTRSVINRLKELLLRILESSFMQCDNEEEKNYYSNLYEIAQREEKLINSFLIGKSAWLHKASLDRLDDADDITDSKNIKPKVFQNHLVTEIVYLIKYLDEYIFVQMHREEKDFPLILEKYKPILLWGVRRYGNAKRNNESEDLYQEFSIVLWNCIQRWQGFPSEDRGRSRAQMLSFATYLKVALRNKCYDFWRKEQADKRLVRGLTVGSLDEGDESFVSQQVSQQIALEWLRKELAEEPTPL